MQWSALTFPEEDTSMRDYHSHHASLNPQSQSVSLIISPVISGLHVDITSWPFTKYMTFNIITCQKTQMEGLRSQMDWFKALSWDLITVTDSTVFHYYYISCTQSHVQHIHVSQRAQIPVDEIIHQQWEGKKEGLQKLKHTLLASQSSRMYIIIKTKWESLTLSPDYTTRSSTCCLGNKNTQNETNGTGPFLIH